MAIKYPHQSPFCYVGNRPINVIDPKGLDEFKISKKNGTISKTNENKYYKNGNEIIDGQNYHGDLDLSKLPQMDRITNCKGESMYFSAESISEANVKSPKTFPFQNQSEAESFYYFAAESTDVEWALAKVNSKSPGGQGFGVVGSDFKEGSTSLPSKFEKQWGDDITFISHSHPNATGIYGMPSFDVWNGKSNNGGDLNNASRSPYKNIIREVYSPQDRNIYEYNGGTLFEARRDKFNPQYRFTRSRMKK